MYVQSKCRLPTSPKVPGHHPRADPAGRREAEAFGDQDPEGHGVPDARFRQTAFGSAKGLFGVLNVVYFYKTAFISNKRTHRVHS